MALFSTRTDYALILLVALARQKDFWSLRLLAKDFHLPYRYVSRLAVSLKKAGYLKSREGIQGGYALAKSPRSIRVIDIIELFEGEMAPTRCTKKNGYCPHEKDCCMRGNWVIMQKQLLNVLKHYTIADFK
ncbi:Rrf2 family transcriptional regulator [Candidatus Parcubacteria bacterium]|jgi:Rrf2 family protein|nr:MAG: Rrf2 family transcriptional regulator [Candidatus Parcubacteria bacterium]